MTKKKPIRWKNNIVGHGVMPAGQFLANPLNWRLHPEFQQEALSGALDEIGWIDEVTVNKRTGRVVDGHLRVTLALRQGEQEPVPYREIDVSEDQEYLALATKDPIAALAATDSTQLNEVLHQVATGDAALQQMLDEMTFDAEIAALIAGGEPEGGRQLGDRRKQVKVVLYVDQLSTFEEAILSTDNPNRGEALAEICAAYLDAKRQLDL